jgi:hypothetical protein
MMKIVMRLRIGHMRRPNLSSIHDDAPDFFLLLLTCRLLLQQAPFAFLSQQILPAFFLIVVICYVYVFVV